VMMHSLSPAGEAHARRLWAGGGEAAHAGGGCHVHLAYGDILPCVPVVCVVVQRLASLAGASRRARPAPRGHPYYGAMKDIWAKMAVRDQVPCALIVSTR
jgi:hypothetical protein